MRFPWVRLTTFVVLTLSGEIAGIFGTDVTFVDEDLLLSLEGPIHENNPEAVELLHEFKESFLAAGKGPSEPCSREDQAMIQERRSVQNYQINQLTLPIEIHQLGSIINATWYAVRRFPNFCRHDPFWTKSETDLTCSEGGVCCAVRDVALGKCKGGKENRNVTQSLASIGLVEVSSEAKQTAGATTLAPNTTIGYYLKTKRGQKSRAVNRSMKSYLLTVLILWRMVLLALVLP